MVAVACCYAGPAADGEAVLQALRDFGPPAADVVAPIPYTLLQALFDATSPPGTHAYWKTEYLADLTDEANDVLVDVAAQIPDLHRFTTMHVHHLEGAVAQQPPGGSAFSHRDPASCSTSSGRGWTTTPTGTSAGYVTPGTGSACTPPATPTSTSWATKAPTGSAPPTATKPSPGSWRSRRPTTPKTSSTSTKTSRPIPSLGSGTRIRSDQDDRPDRRSGQLGHRVPGAAERHPQLVESGGHRRWGAWWVRPGAETTLKPR